MAFQVFSANIPKGFTVGTTPVKIATKRSTGDHTVLSVANLSDSATVFLGFDYLDSVAGNAEKDKGMVLFPRSQIIFDAGTFPSDVTVWAVSDTVDTKVAVQD